MRACFCLASLLALSAAATHAEQAEPRFTPDGTVQVPAFDLPPSELASAVCARRRRHGSKNPISPPVASSSTR